MNHRRFFSALLAAAALAAVAGCATPNVATIPYPNMPAFPATNPAQVTILRAEPTRPHVRLGEITVDSRAATAQQVTAGLRTAAAKLGADAAVVVVDSQGGAVASSAWWGGTPPGTIAGPDVIAVAIRYPR